MGKAPSEWGGEFGAALDEAVSLATKWVQASSRQRTILADAIEIIIKYAKAQGASVEAIGQIEDWVVNQLGDE